MDELPLLELFTRLREAGLPLGIDEYRLVLRALQAGFGTTDRNALARLCQTLWVKSPDEARLFRYHFDRIMPEMMEREPESPSTSPESSSKQPRSASTPSPTRPKAKTTETTTQAVADSEMALKMEDEIQVAKAVRYAITDDEIPYTRFSLTTDYLPVTRRQMKQSWRYLRRPVREGPPVELDATATVNQIGRQGLLLAPVLVPRRINRSELLLMLDQDGSMVPFHALSRRLAETAIRGGRLGQAGIFYFHNCPVTYLYHDPHHLDAKPIENILAQCHPQRTVVLIFSDAGAARGSFNVERLELTQQFLDQLNQKVRYSVWLNPLPRSRWANTMASEIANRIPMFETTRRGLDNAIDVLRGRFKR